METTTILGLKEGLTTELIAADLRHTLHWLGEITGEVSNDELLGSICAELQWRVEEAGAEALVLSLSKHLWEVLYWQIGGYWGMPCTEQH